MSYKNIVFIKLYLDLFDNDDRFLYQLNESQQLLYIKLLYLAGRSHNKISKNIAFVKNKVNYHHDETCYKSDIDRIKEVFHKFKENKDFYYFEKFEILHNRIDDFKVGSSQGVPKDVLKEKKVKEKEKKEKETPLSDEQRTQIHKMNQNLINKLTVSRDI